jgi:hypothetical protein
MCECIDELRETCPFADTPRWMYTVMGIWARCRSWNALPGPGSMDEQPALLMRLLEVIDGEMQAYRDAKNRLRETEMKRQSTTWGHRGSRR